MISIAIDGTSGAGKSTVADILAEKLGIMHLNSGALYRACGLYMLEHNIDPHDGDRVCKVLPKCKISVKFEDGKQRTILCGIDVTDKLYSSVMSDYSSIVSQYERVREYIKHVQQDIAKDHSIIIEGRDITSVVLPNADFKFFLTTSVEIRASRRLKDLVKAGEKVTYDEVLAELKERDYRDTTRAINPLIIVPDAIVIDTSKLDQYEVADYMIKVIKDRRG